MGSIPEKKDDFLGISHTEIGKKGQSSPLFDYWSHAYFKQPNGLWWAEVLNIQAMKR